MPVIYFELENGEVQRVEAVTGRSLMEAARDHSVPGIVGECGGSLACATCHVYVDNGWKERLGAPSPMEAQLLEGVLNPRPNSRLSCQIVVTDNMNDLRLHVPAEFE